MLDFTPLVRQVWEQRRSRDKVPRLQEGYSVLLEHPEYALGEAIFYIYVRGVKSQ